MRATEAGKLVLSILVCEGIGGAPGVLVAPAVGSWYKTIEKPWFTPPSWAFAPVWTALFLLMGISLFTLWRSGLRSRTSGVALAFFAAQLTLNVAWSFIFFGLALFFYGLVEIIALWGAIALTIAASLRVSRTGGILLIPYIAWVTVAALLNYYIWVLNL